MILPPRRPTWARYRRLSNPRYTLLRSLEYEALDGLSLPGRVLDVGGGRVNSYYHLLRTDQPIDSINISTHVNPTLIGDLNQPMPIATGSYDHAICLNTLEHLVHDEVAMEEIMRVVRPRGTFHIIVPFLYRVHGSPHDYHRHTAEWWAQRMARCEHRPQEVVIDPLIWDAHSSAAAIVNFVPFRRLARRLVMLPALRHGRRCGRGERVENQRYIDYYLAYPLGFYIRGVR